MKRLFLYLLLSFNSSWAFAQGEYLSQNDFLSRAFSDSTPVMKKLWLRGDFKQEVKSLLGHNYKKIRIKYWQYEKTTAWILEEIGKEEPITAGFVVANQTIQQAHVLQFRESRGWEVRRKAFTQQFEMAKLSSDNQLTKHVDGITGATLSVNAMMRMSKLALLLHKQVLTKDEKNK